MKPIYDKLCGECGFEIEDCVCNDIDTDAVLAACVRTPQEPPRYVPARPVNVINPSHYRGGNEETIDKMRRTRGDAFVLAGCEFNVFKYTDRAGKKDGVPAHIDLSKAAWYGQMIKHILEGVADPREGDLNEGHCYVAAFRIKYGI